MWWAVCTVVFVRAIGGQIYHHDSYGGQDLDDSYDDEAPASTPGHVFDALTRVRRYGGGKVRALNHQELDDVKGALKELLSGRNVDFVPRQSLLVSDEVTTNRTEDNDTKLFNVTLDTSIVDQGTTTELTPTRSRLTTTVVNEDEDWFRERAIVGLRGKTTTSVPTTTETETTTTTTKRTRSPRFDIEALLAIVANLTYDYDTNLTMQLNETLQRFSIPTCATPTTTTTTTTEPTTTEVWYNTTVVAKCFVCGLETQGIPRNAHCADAFATDFLPLLPVDPRAKGQIARFRKYCRYFDVNNYQLNHSDPRAMLGRWTGGCAVRWTDVSGVYTQRTCRNRVRPTTGKHFASKRMAKIELALNNVDDGCIISPMATLVPLSRGISLYARFHACVCSGNWCNRAIGMQQCKANLWLLLVMIEVMR